MTNQDIKKKDTPYETLCATLGCPRFHTEKDCSQTSQCGYGVDALICYECGNCNCDCNFSKKWNTCRCVSERALQIFQKLDKNQQTSLNLCELLWTTMPNAPYELKRTDYSILYSNNLSVAYFRLNHIEDLDVALYVECGDRTGTWNAEYSLVEALDMLDRINEEVFSST